MKRLLIILALFGSVGLHADQKKETLADMTLAKKVFIGWVDINLDDYLPLGYENKQAWSEVIDSHNRLFQQVCQTNLPGRQITGASNRSDDNASGQDLYVKFSDVRFDTDSYRLFASVHFIDPQSGVELASLSVQGYRGGHFSVSNCLEGALEKLAEKLKVEIARSPKK